MIFRCVDVFCSEEVLLVLLIFGDFYIDIVLCMVDLGGKWVYLMVKEFDFLLYFVKNLGCVYLCIDLFDSVWGYVYEGYEYIVNFYINWFCNKIEDDLCKLRFVLIVWGVGYCFMEVGELMFN